MPIIRLFFFRRSLQDPESLFVNNASLAFLKNRNIEITLPMFVQLENYIQEMYLGAPSLVYSHLKKDDKEKLFLKTKAVFHKAQLLLNKNPSQQKVLFYYIP